MDWQQFLSLTFFNNRIADYLVFIAFILAGVLAVKLFVLFILHKLQQWSKKTATDIDEFLLGLVEKTLVPLAYFYIMYLSLAYLTLPAGLRHAVEVLWAVALTVSLLSLAATVLDYALQHYWLRKEKDESRLKSLKGILVVVKVLIWGLGLTFMLDNLGFKVSAVIAGLGIGGIAVALAAQAVLGDLFSYFAIFFDRPFEVGDFIIVGDFLGSVEHIGIKTTRLRSLGGEQLIFSNTDLTNSRVRNYKRMSRRRIVFKFGLVYDTTVEQLRKVPEIVKEIFKKTGNVDLDRAHFFSFADFSLVFEVVYFVNSPEYNKYMDIQQDINLALKEELEKQGMQFAFPTQTVHLKQSS